MTTISDQQKIQINTQEEDQAVINSELEPDQDYFDYSNALTFVESFGDASKNQNANQLECKSSNNRLGLNSVFQHNMIQPNNDFVSERSMLKNQSDEQESAED